MLYGTLFACCDASVSVACLYTCYFALHTPVILYLLALTPVITYFLFCLMHSYVQICSFMRIAGQRG